MNMDIAFIIDIAVIVAAISFTVGFAAGLFTGKKK